jgi:hypothetical protein
MQGVYNNVNNASRQHFFNNRVIARTSKVGGASNIYGAWFTGTGLRGLYVYDNTFEGCSYGFQLNNQDGAGRDVNTNPLGSPTYDVFVHDNEFIDCTLGVNTPHIFCYNVHIHHNTLRQVSKSIDLPLNVAHVAGLTVTANNVTCNVASSNAAIHIEDVSQKATVADNVVTVTAANHGIALLQVSGVSQDDQPTMRATITGNTVRGSGTAGTEAGILLPDVQSFDNLVAGNHVSNFGRGIDVVGDNTVSDNTITDCGTGLSLGESTAVAVGNVFKRCTYVARNIANGSVTLLGGFIVGDTFAFDKQGNGTFLLSGVTLKRTSTTNFAASTPFDVMPLPATYKFTGTVNLQFNIGFGFSKHTFTWDGTTFTPTRVADAQLSTLGGLTLSKSGSTLQAASGTASGSGRFNVLMDGLVY